MKIDMQFLDRKQYLDLHAELTKIDYSPQSEAALTNLKVLLLLEISLLHGCDFDWSPPVAGSVSEGEVLGAGAALAADDANNFRKEQGTHATAPAAVPAPAAAPASAPARAQSPAGIVDVNDFITWTSETWALLDLDSITFPTDQAINIRSVRSYLAVTIIMWYQADLRDKRVWDELNYAWLAPPRAPADVSPATLKRRRNPDPVQQISKRYICYDYWNYYYYLDYRVCL
jgi:hypothetical protein